METEKTTSIDSKTIVKLQSFSTLPGAMIWMWGVAKVLLKCLSVYCLLLWQFPSQKPCIEMQLIGL